MKLKEALLCFLRGIRRHDIWPALVAAMALLIPPMARAEIRQENWCVLVEKDYETSFVVREDNEAEENDDDIAPKVATVRPPFAEEVGPPAGAETDSIMPLPGLPLDTSFDSVGWIPNGPGPAKYGDLNIAPDYPTSGCVTAITPHPSNQNILYIGTANGGVWRTDNALDANPRWKPLTDDQLSLSIGGLAIDPTDSSGNTLVAGIGRRSSYFFNGGALKGLLRTTNGGTNWTLLAGTNGTDLANRSIFNLAARGNTMLLAVPGTDNGTLPGLYRTTDGGASFINMSGLASSHLPAGVVTHLAADPSNLARFYVHVSGNGIYRSDDSGATWANASFGGLSPAELALTVSFNGTVFAAELVAISRVWRSTNMGSNWVQMDSVQAKTNGLWHAFAPDPANPQLVYLSGSFVRPGFPYSGRVVRGDASLPAGSQWTPIASTNVQGIGTAPHTDSRALAFTAGNRLIEGDDGGVFELPIANTGTEGTISGSTGSNWRSLNGNIQNSEMHTMAYDPVARAFVGGGQDTGMLEQMTSGTTPWLTLLTGDGGDAAVDILTSPGQSIQYGSVQNFQAFYRAIFDANNNLLDVAFPATTLVGGGTPIIAGGPSNNMPFVASVEMNAVSGGRLIICGNADVYESGDQGETVTDIDPVAANQLARIAYGGRLNGANAPDVLFYGSGTNIRKRTTAGGAFSSVAFPGGTVQGIAFDPQNWQTAYIIGTTTVYSATGGAASFTNVTGNLTGVGTFHTVTYLTLPDGNAIVVGADLGVFLMRVATPGVWTTLGDNLPHAPVFDSTFDAAGQVLAISTLGRGAWLYDFKSTKPVSQYGETFQAFTGGTSTLPARTGELFSSRLGDAAAVVDPDLRELQLTSENLDATFTAFRLPNLDPGFARVAFSAKWNASIYGNTSFGIADGFSFNFGQLGGITGAAFTNGTYANEDGFNVGLTVSVRTYSGNTPGYYVRVNGAVVPGGFVSKPSANWGNHNTTRHFFEVDWRLDTGLTLRVDGVAIFTNLPTPGFTPAPNDRFAFGARDGSLTETVAIDNIAVFTGGVLAKITPAAPYYFSGDFPPNNQTADKAFDGNVNTKWLTTDYTGFIGATIPANKTVRLYTLTCGEDLPARDLFAWDFQTSDDGTKWFQHGAQSAQNFANRSEQRAFVVANPTANTKFRALISANNLDANTQLSEFQPWELIQPQLSVTTASDSGPNSLRQKLAGAATYGGGTVTFDPSLANQTVLLANEIVVTGSAGVAIDGSTLNAGVTIDGGHGTNRLFTVNSGASLSLTGVTLTDGNGTGASSSGDGGAIYNQGTLTLSGCTITGNVANATAGRIGGAILNQGTLKMTQCTLFGNSTNGFGGAIFNANTATLTHCTISGNSASSNGGGIDNGNGATITLTLNNTIVAGNTAGFGNDLNNFNGIVTRGGANIVQGYTGIAATGGGTISNVNPLLAPLDDYGGLTKTMALILGSPARNASVGSTVTSDQRGFPIVGTPDIGAYEAGTYSNYNAWIWEVLPASASVAQHSMSTDYDGDGLTNGNEYLALTDPGNVLSVFRITQVSFPGADFQVTFPTNTGRTYTIDYSTDLAGWIPSGSYSGTGSPLTIPVIGARAFPKFFVRVRVGP